MRINEYTNQHRFDFDAILECEHCSYVQPLKNGYDDAYFHTKVLPRVNCKGCGKDRDGFLKGERAKADRIRKGES